MSAVVQLGALAAAAAAGSLPAPAGLASLAHAHGLHPSMEGLAVYLNATLHADPTAAESLLQIAARQIRVVHYCEAKAGGLFRGYVRQGAPSEAGIFPEIGACLTAPFIALCGVHMLVFWTQDGSPFLKILAALFVANGAGSFLMHAYGKYSWLRVDAHTMILAVWLVACYCVDEFTKAKLNKRFERYLWKTAAANDAQVLRLGRSYARWKNLRTVFVTCMWCFGVWVCFWNNETELAVPGDQELGRIIPGLGVILFAAPLVGLLGLGVVLVRGGYVNGEYVETYYEHIARWRLMGGAVAAICGVTLWMLCESLCLEHPVFAWLPGHAIFHLSMAIGLTNAMLYAALLRADSCKLYAHIWLPASHIVTCARARARELSRVTRAYARRAAPPTPYDRPAHRQRGRRGTAGHAKELVRESTRAGQSCGLGKCAPRRDELLAPCRALVYGRFQARGAEVARIAMPACWWAERDRLAGR